MNADVLIILPQWVVWLLMLLAALNLIEVGLKAYYHWVSAQIARLNARKEIPDGRLR